MKPFDSFHNPRRHKDDKVQALLKDNGFRKLFLQTLDLCKKYYSKNATHDFLQNCVTSEIIPKTFMVKNNLADNLSQDQKTKWIENSKAASLEILKLSVSELSSLKSDIYGKYRSSLNYLLKDLSHTDRTAVEKLFLEKCDLYNFISMKEKSHKLKYLMDKQGNPMDSEKNTKRSRPGLQSRTKWRRKKESSVKAKCFCCF